tara:strand:- start:805 stop:1254 length:450 start_codon:yes stop_codon:yes gene_type:complete
MAHFAKISEENKVLSILKIDNLNTVNSDGIEDESVGQEFLETNNDWPRHLWIQTSVNTLGNQHLGEGTPFRGNYAGVGFTWDSENELFWPEKPYASWVKNMTDVRWQSPIGDPPAFTAEQQSQNEADTHQWGYSWNESGQSWDLTDAKA